VRPSNSAAITAARKKISRREGRRLRRLGRDRGGAGLRCLCGAAFGRLRAGARAVSDRFFPEGGRDGAFLTALPATGFAAWEPV
jgi:hypothetical protein